VDCGGLCKALGLRECNCYRWRSQKDKGLSLKSDERAVVNKIVTTSLAGGFFAGLTTHYAGAH
jgi:hypothetical protein